MENFFSSLKTEPTARKVYRSHDEAQADVFDYIERFYNPKRRDSTIGYTSPHGVLLPNVRDGSVKLRRTHLEQISSGLPLKPDIARRISRPESPAIARMPDQRGYNGKPFCQPSQPPHEYGPGIRPKDATDKEARPPRSRGRSVVVLYNEIRTHRSLDKDAPVSRRVQRTGIIVSHPILGGLHHHYLRV
jgi:hypothetical protein